MKDYYIDSILPNSFFEVRDYLFKELSPTIKSKNHIIFICIGTDRTTGASLGPIVGYKLKNHKREFIHFYGSLESPIHLDNLNTIMTNIKNNYENPYIITINAALGSFHHVGKIIISKNTNNNDSVKISITGIVNISGKFEFMILQNTRLYTVMTLADCISNGIYHFILKSFGGTLLEKEYIH